MPEWLRYWIGRPFSSFRRGDNNFRLFTKKVRTGIVGIVRWIAFESLSILGTFACVALSGFLSAVLLSRYRLSLPISPGWVHLGLTALSASIFVPLIFRLQYFVNRDRWHEYRRRLNQACRADNDPFVAKIDIRPEGTCDKRNFVRQFNEVSEDVSNVLLILRQTGRRWWENRFPYTVHSMRAQLLARRDDEVANSKKIEWVCFVTHDEIFVAYQRFSDVYADIVDKNNATYADIMNIKDPTKFVEKITDQIKAEKTWKATGKTEPGMILRLQTGMLPNTFLRHKAITVLRNRGDSEAMMVSKNDYKPVGIVTLAKLLEQTSVADLIHDDDAALFKWTEDWEKKKAKLIKSNPPGTRPTDSADDNPELDGMIPPGSADLRARLRFTRP